MSDVPLLALCVVQLGRRGGTHSQQKMLIERCLQDQALESALSWRLEESACRTHERFRDLRNLDSRLLIRGSKKIVGPPA
jgi:hypothetical protein